jgi:hypothetical protein
MRGDAVGFGTGNSQSKRLRLLGRCTGGHKRGQRQRFDLAQGHRHLIHITWLIGDTLSLGGTQSLSIRPAPAPSRRERSLAGT